MTAIITMSNNKLDLLALLFSNAEFVPFLGVIDLQPATFTSFFSVLTGVVGV